MTFLEIAIANQILARRGETRNLEFYDEDGLRILLRIALAFAAFAAFLLWLQAAATS